MQRQQRNKRVSARRVFHRITIPTGLSLERQTSPLAGPTNNAISELRLAASDEPLSDYRRRVSTDFGDIQPNGVVVEIDRFLHANAFW